MKDFIENIQQAVAFYFNIAVNNYQNLSSFAIVTDESFDTFLIAINTNHSFEKLQQGIICSEDYWNTAEWQEESLDTVYFNENIESIQDFLGQNTIDENVFFGACLDALKRIKRDDICMFLHITDFEFHQELYNIVNQLNGEEIANSYKDYYLE